MVAPRAGLEPATSRLQGLPIFREGLDYLFTRLCDRRGCRALMRHYWVGSSASSLCTFLPIPSPQQWAVRQDSLRITVSPVSEVGFPEFTRCFNHSLLWKLQLLQPAALPTELPGNGIQLKRSHCSINHGNQGDRFCERNKEWSRTSPVYTSKSSVSSSSDVASVLPDATAA
jgi:hypothetical protein